MTTRAQPIPVGAGYVALGDSFASGPGIRTTVDAPCARSDDNYPHQVAAALELALTDVTCRGASLAEILSIPESSGLHGPPVPRQVDALARDTSLVTVTAGTNDVGFMAALRTWSAQHAAERGRLPHGSGSVTTGAPRPVDRQRIEASLREIGLRLGDVVSSVRSHSPAARVVLVDYLTVLPPVGTEVDEIPITPDEHAFLWDVATALEAATADVAASHGVTLVRASAASRDHYAGSSDPWVTGCFPLRHLPPFLPSVAGHTAIAQLVLAALRSPT